MSERAGITKPTIGQNLPAHGTETADTDEIIPYSESEINTLEEAPSFQNDS
jgi:hypothetical protein